MDLYTCALLFHKFDFRFLFISPSILSSGLLSVFLQVNLQFPFVPTDFLSSPVTSTPSQFHFIMSRAKNRLHLSEEGEKHAGHACLLIQVCVLKGEDRVRAGDEESLRRVYDERVKAAAAVKRLGTHDEWCERVFFDFRLDGSWSIHFGNGRAHERE